MSDTIKVLDDELKQYNLTFLKKPILIGGKVNLDLLIITMYLQNNVK